LERGVTILHRKCCLP